MQSLSEHLACFLTFHCSSDFCGMPSVFLPHKRATHKECPFLIAGTWGAPNRQSPFKINELNDGQRSCSGGFRGRGHGHGRRKKTGLLLSDNDVRPVLAPSPILPTPSRHPFHPVFPEPPQIERQGDYEDVSWSVGRREGHSAPDEVRGELRRVTHGRPCVCV